jgi:hypothetical protein
MSAAPVLFELVLPLTGGVLVIDELERPDRPLVLTGLAAELAEPPW